MRFKTIANVTVIALIGLGATLLAQQPGGQKGQGGQGGGRGGGGGMFCGGFVNRMNLLTVAEVKKELDLADEQVAAIEKLDAELQEKYPFGGGRGGQGGGKGGKGGKGGNGQGAIAAPVQWYFVQAQQPDQKGRGGRFGQPQTPEEQAAQAQTRLERAREERAKLAEILLPHQIKRLNEIYIQRAGASALADEQIAQDLGLSDAQKTKVTEIGQQNRDSMMRERFQGGGGGDPQAAQARMEELRKAGDATLLAVLTPEQQKKFEEMKGKPFEMPEPMGRGGQGGRGVQGGQNRGKGGNNNNKS